MTTPTTPGPTTRWPRWGAALGLFALSPVCAEYVSGYDSTTGHPLQLLAGLLVLAPLYGAPALLLREVARRRGLGWPGVLSLAAAAGVVQAGIVDQSLFASDYRAIDWWPDAYGSTLVEPLGVSAYLALAFVGGHVLWTFAGPIALVEGLAPRAAREPWLRAPGIVVCAVLYLLATAAVLVDHLRTEDEHASVPQLVGAALLAAVLVAVPLLRGRRHHVQPGGRRGSGPVPRPLALGGLALGGGVVVGLVPWTWAGLAAQLAVVVAVAAAARRWSRRTAWDGRHAAALCAGALLSLALTSVLTDPVGDVEPWRKYLHNACAAAGVVLLGCLASHPRRARTPVPR